MCGEDAFLAFLRLSLHLAVFQVATAISPAAPAGRVFGRNIGAFKQGDQTGPRCAS
jgi:hypothetical protein